MGWVFREQPFEDYGVDAHVEVVDNGDVLGWLLGMQIKSGASYFRVATYGGWWFRESVTHFRYWLGYSIPVVIVLADIDSEQCYWQLVTASTVVAEGGSGCKLWVPRSQVLESSAVGPLRVAAEVGARKAHDRQPVGALITELDPTELEVHPAFPGAGAYSGGPPEYLPRSHDELLDELAEGALSPRAKSRLAVLVGPAGSGKTRALYEMLHRPVGPGPGTASLADAGWRVWPALNPLPPRRFLEELTLVGPRTVVWLNEAQRYLRDPSAELRADIATGLRELLADNLRGPVLVLGTLWREYWNELTRSPDEGKTDQFGTARRLLEGSYVRVPDTFTNAEVSAARKSGDQRVADAANQNVGSGVTQNLAGAPDLLRRYETASAAQHAVIHAAMDARRLGHHENLSETFLREAARCYLTGSERRRGDEEPSWFDNAVADLVRPGTASGPMLYQNHFGYRLDDFLDQEGRVRRRLTFPPDEFWSVAAESNVAPDSLVRLAESAASRLRLQIAVLLYEAAGTEAAGRGLHDIAMRCERGHLPHAAERLVQSSVAAGFPGALMSLARSRHLRRNGHDPSVVRLLRQATELGNVDAFDLLAYLLELSGDKEGAEAVARKALDLGAWQATVSVAEWRDLDSANEAEKLIHDLPVAMRSAALASLVTSRDGADNPDEAERLALAVAADGDVEALLQLADHRAQTGRRAAARRLLEYIAWPDTIEGRLRLALIHVHAGNHSEARSMVKSAVDAGTELTTNRGLGHKDMDEQMVTFAEKQPRAVDQLAEALRALGEDQLAGRLFEALRPVRAGTSAQCYEDEEPPDKTEDELARAYATLSEFHAKRGEFEEAESLAFKTATVGNSRGLEIVSHELCQRGDRDAAERLALCAVNMTEPWAGSMDAADTSWTTLAEARADDALLISGLEADGTTSDPW
jgi:tetratricopeptide (TPR) repeat protein